MHGNIAFKMPALKGCIVRPESIINSLNQVIAVNWMTSSKGEKQERNSLHWSYVLYNCKIKSKISINNNINFKLRYDRRSGYWNLSNCKLTWKKISTSRGFKPMASVLGLQCSTNWAMKIHTLGAGQFVEFILTHDWNET